MEEKIIRLIQQEAAEALLNVGVSLPLKEFRLPFRKKPVVLRVTMPPGMSRSASRKRMTVARLKMKPTKL